MAGGFWAGRRGLCGRRLGLGGGVAGLAAPDSSAGSLKGRRILSVRQTGPAESERQGAGATTGVASSVCLVYRREGSTHRR